MQLKGKSWQNFQSSCEAINQSIDQAWMKSLIDIYIQSLDNLSKYKHKKALEMIEKQFWLFCDNYLELIKARVYQQKGKKEGNSGEESLSSSLYLFLQLFAPYLPYVTEEVWQNQYSLGGSSLHQSLYLQKELLTQLSENFAKKSTTFSESKNMKKLVVSILESKTDNEKSNEHLKAQLNSDHLLENAFFILEEVRNQKSVLGKSLASPLKQLKIRANFQYLQTFQFYKEDISRATHVNLENIVLEEQSDIQKTLIEIQLEKSLS